MIHDPYDLKLKLHEHFDRACGVNIVRFGMYQEHENYGTVMTKLKLVTAASVACLLSACGGSLESIAAGIVTGGDCIGDNCDDNGSGS